MALTQSHFNLDRGGVRVRGQGQEVNSDTHKVTL